MTTDVKEYEIRFDARLVEECVLIAEAGRHDKLRMRFRLERDRLYARGDPEERDRLFERFHRRWFERLGLAGPLLRALDGSAQLKSSTRRCVVMPAAEASSEGADLRDERPLGGRDAAPDVRPTVILQLRPRTLVDSKMLWLLLDHELLHIQDMLDPSFGYRTELPAVGPGPARERRVKERYRVLWDCTIDGRLLRRGRLGQDVAAGRRLELRAAFPELSSDTEAHFQRWFEGTRPAHDEMLAAAIEGIAHASSGICPLCKFTYSGPLRSPELPRAVADSIGADYPDWRPEHGLCRQCFDLYSASLQPTSVS